MAKAAAGRKARARASFLGAGFADAIIAREAAGVVLAGAVGLCAVGLWTFDSRDAVLEWVPVSNAAGVLGASVAGVLARVAGLAAWGFVLAGAAIGAVIGREIGDEMDERDRACFGHALELLDDGRRVNWDGGRQGIAYTLAPDGRFERDGRVCRHFTLTRMLDGRPLSRQGNACRYGEGDWRMIKA